MAGPPFKVRALYEYSSSHEDDLNFPSGQIITVTEEEDTDWYSGEYIDASGATKSGIFPRNFVERYEPEPPPRPMRSTRGRKAAPSAQEAQAVGDNQPHSLAEAASGHQTKANTEEEKTPQANVVEKRKSTVTEGRPSLEPRRVSNVTPKPPPEVSQTSAPTDAQPPPAEKPVASSFKDRIAAFNKPAAAPVTPAKPAGLTAGGTNFVHKAFVAPPPSRDSYVPPPREAPQTIFRREPEAEKHAAAQPLPERPPQASGDNEDEAQVKPTSLKERIALLQKQQLENAMRYADPSQKREPAKKPPKPQRQATGSSDKYAEGASGAPADVQTNDSRDTGHGTATVDDMSHSNEGLASDTVLTGPLPSARHIRTNDDSGDANDADQSGVDDTAEDPEDQPISQENVHGKPQSHPLPSLPGASVNADRSSAVQDQVTAADDGNGSTEEADMDPELKRRMEIRDRMAKMSGGMGMHGMFGFPGGIPKPAVSDKQNKKMPAGDIHMMPTVVDSKEQQAAPQPTESSAHSSSQHLKIRLPALAAPQERIADISDTEAPLSNSPTDIKSVEAGDDGSMDLVKPTTPVPEVESGKRLSTSPRTAVPVPRIPTVTTDEDDLPPRSPPPLPRNVLPLERSTLSPSIGSESDDEMSLHPGSPPAKRSSNVFERSMQNAEPSSPVPPPPSLPRTASKRMSSLHTAHRGIELPSSGVPEDSTDNDSPVTAMMNDETKQGTSMTRSRPLPPPPPSQAPPAPLLSRQSTGDTKTLKSLHTADHHVSDEEATAYEGDYDTDMASTATHKTAIRHQSHEHGHSHALPDTLVVGQHKPTPSNPPPPIPRVPPPQATTYPDNTRPTIPRAAPPPIPTARIQDTEPDDHYDSDRYEASPKDSIGQDVAIPEGGSVSSPVSIREGDASYPTSRLAGRRPNAPSRQSTDISPYAEPPSIQRLDSSELQPPPHSPGAGARDSLDGTRHFASTRRSAEQGRASTDLGYIARDVDLGKNSRWWLEAKGVPPVFRSRTDITYEMEESRTTKRGGKTVVARDVYVLFQDYSQTIVTARYDAAAGAGGSAPQEVSLEQRHEPPPPRLRQDQLEAAHTRFGRRIAEAAAARAGTTVGDGQPLALVLELLRPLSGALAPVGTRAFGAPVYVNLANASVQQHDEIRAGDVVSFRNARFQGHRGPMHQKYSFDVGRGSGSGSGAGAGAGTGSSAGTGAGAGAGLGGAGVGVDYHVGVVVDWDGTKKKVRVWEQGRESRKVKVESFKLGDLRSGEVKVWRVVGRDWVNWETPPPTTTASSSS